MFTAFVRVAPIRTRVWSSGLFALLSIAPRSAAAQPAGIRFVFTDKSNASCPDESALRSAATERLGYDPFALSGRAAVHASISRTGRGLRGEIRIEDPARDTHATHAIESASSDCSELAKAMALSISIAVGAMRPSNAPAPDAPPSGTESGKTTMPARARTGNPTGASPTALEDAHLTPPAEEPELQGAGSVASDVKAESRVRPLLELEEPHWKASFDALTSVGFAPGVTAGGALGGGWVGQSSSVGIEVRADLPQSIDQGPGSIHVWPLLFTVAPCVNVRGWAFCGLGRVGRLHGSGRGYATNLSGSSLLATVGARLANEAILSQPIRLRVLFDLDWLATSNSFDVDQKPGWAVSTWAVSLGIGLAFHLH